MLRLKLREALIEYHAKTGTRLTYSEIAGRTGLSVATVESLATREGYNTTLSTIAKLCEVLECQPGDLLEYVR